MLENIINNNNHLLTIQENNYCVNSIVFKSKIGLGNARQREENFGERGMFV